MASKKTTGPVLTNASKIAMACGTISGMDDKLAAINSLLIDISSRCARATEKLDGVKGVDPKDLETLADVLRLAEDRFFDCHEVRSRLRELSTRTKNWS